MAIWLKRGVTEGTRAERLGRVEDLMGAIVYLASKRRLWSLAQASSSMVDGLRTNQGFR